MTLAEALAALGLPADATRADAKARCRRWVTRAEWEQGTGIAFWFVAAWADGRSEAAIIAEQTAEWGSNHLRPRKRRAA